MKIITAQKMIASQLSVPDIKVLELMTPEAGLWFARCIGDGSLEKEKQAASNPLDPDVAKKVYNESPKQFAVQIQNGQCRLIQSDEIDDLKKTYRKGKFIED